MGIRDERLFREAIALSHIVKYSNQRLGRLKDNINYNPPLLEVETLGMTGSAIVDEMATTVDHAGERWRRIRWPDTGHRRFG